MILRRNLQVDGRRGGEVVGNVVLCILDTRYLASAPNSPGHVISRFLPLSLGCRCRYGWTCPKMSTSIWFLELSEFSSMSEPSAAIVCEDVGLRALVARPGGVRTRGLLNYVSVLKPALVRYSISLITSQLLQLFGTYQSIYHERPKQRSLQQALH